MTCVVGFVDGKNVLMGCDSYVGNGMFTQKLKTKIVRRGKRLGIGFSGSLRAGQIIENNLKITIGPKEDARTWMHKKFLPKIQSLFDAMLPPSHDPHGHDDGWNLLVAANGHLFFISSELAVLEGVEVGGYKFHSIGSGSLYALGAIHGALHFAEVKVDAKQMVLQGLHSASELTSTVAAPFVLEKF